MTGTLFMNWAAVASMVPAALLPISAAPGRRFWLCLTLAVAGPVLLAIHLLSGDWNGALSMALWMGIAASMTVFFVLSLLDAQAWRLARLLVPYLLALAVLAVLAPGSAGTENIAGAPPAWIALHIVVSVVALAILTPAAIAALSSFLQSHALKAKRPTALSRHLPPLADSDRLAQRLLLAAEMVLGLGVVSGIVTEYAQSGHMFVFSHKVLFSLIAFFLIGCLLAARPLCGLRGQVAARIALLAYLFVISGYFGMKFVHQVLLG